MIGPKCELIDYVDVIQTEDGSGEGLLSEVMDPYDSTGGKVFGTIIYFPKPMQGPLYLFTSPIVHKTMYAGSVKSRYISMSRDLGLHQTLCQMRMQAVQRNQPRPDVDTTLIGCYTVMRGHGKYHKTNRHLRKKIAVSHFQKAVKAITANKTLTRYGWSFSQADGLVANFRYNGMDDTINKFGIKYRPAVGLRVCMIPVKTPTGCLLVV